MTKFNLPFKLPSFKPRNINSEIHGLVSLRIEKLSGKVLLEKDNDLVLQNLVRFMYHLFANYESDLAPSITLLDQGGNSRTGFIGNSTSGVQYLRHIIGAYTAGNNWFNAGDTGQADRGIVIGIGTTAAARTDYTIQSLVGEGAGAGQIHYNKQTHDNPDNTKFTLTREFTNAGSLIAVTEAGLYGYICIPSGATAYQFLLLHDVFAAVNVSAGNGIRIIYTWSF